MDLFDRIKEHRMKEQDLIWSGTFADYIQILKKRPAAARTAHARVYDMIESHGIIEEDNVRKYRFFEGEIFGLDATLEKLVEEYFHSAARRLDVRKRILMLMGPVSGGNRLL